MNTAGDRDRAMKHPATAAEARAALVSEGPTAEAVQSYLAPGPEPRYDTPRLRAQAEATTNRTDLATLQARAELTGQAYYRALERPDTDPATLTDLDRAAYFADAEWYEAWAAHLDGTELADPETGL